MSTLYSCKAPSTFLHQTWSRKSQNSLAVRLLALATWGLALPLGVATCKYKAVHRPSPSCCTIYQIYAHCCYDLRARPRASATVCSWYALSTTICVSPQGKAPTARLAERRCYHNVITCGKARRFTRAPWPGTRGAVGPRARPPRSHALRGPLPTGASMAP